jgi:hypothetical protein
MASPVVGLTIATTIPAAYTLVVALVGGRADGTVQWWAWLIADGSDLRSWLFAPSALGVGVTVVAVGGWSRAQRRWG